MYDRIAQAIGANVLLEEWKTALADDLCRRWNGRSLAGHVTFGEVHDCFAALPEACGRPGLYVFGAWVGAESRVHYVGIAHGKPLRHRLCSRYVRKPGSRSLSFELAMAQEFAMQFNSVVDDFSPLPRVNVEKYRQAGIPIPHPNRHRRLFRAERWAKIRLESIWFFLIPARPEAAKNELEKMEQELIMASNAVMFRLYCEGAPRAWPLVNIEHGNIVRNPYVEPGLLQQYEAWLSKRSR